MKEEIRQIEYAGRLLARGGSVAGETCPFCLGGMSKDKSFSITKQENGNLVYFCHREKCHRKGVLTPAGTSILNVHTKTKTHRVFTEPTVPLSAGQLGFFEYKYDLSYSELEKAGFLYVPSRDSVYQPVFGPRGAIRGCQIRDYRNKKIDTYKAFKESREPMLCWYLPKGYPIPVGNWSDEKVVIVEDQLSALKLSRYYKTVALMGCSMSQEAVIELTLNSKEQVLMLDRDAIMGALKHQERWKNVLNMAVVACKKDPKYWDEPQLRALNEDGVPW